MQRTPAGFADYEVRMDYLTNYVRVLQSFFPDASLDDEGEVFWDAKERLIEPGDGCSYSSVTREKEFSRRRIRYLYQY